MQPLEDWRNQLSSSKLSSPHSATGSKQFGNGTEKNITYIYMCNYLIMYIYHHKMVGSIPIILNMRHFMGRYIMRPPSGDGAFGVSAAFAASISLDPRCWREGSRPICRCPYTKIEKHCRFMGTDISIPSRCVSISAKVIVLGDSNHWFSHW
jgi:hypothetical protein